MAKGLFVTGTDTGVGKTLVSLGLMQVLQWRGRRVAGMKPVASGCELTPDGLRNPDALALMAQASVVLPYGRVNPYAYQAPIAPHIAAATSQQAIDIDKILSLFQQIAEAVDYVIVEGIGGWKVPLGDETDVSDLARALGLPVMLVVAVRLGCLNHAILTWDAIRSSGAVCAGWVANCANDKVLGAEEIIAYLTARFGVPPVGTLPYFAQGGHSAENVAQVLVLNSQFV